VSGHRRLEQAIHGALRCPEKVGGLSRIETAFPGGDGELLVKRSAKAKESFDGLAQRQPKTRRDAPVFLSRVGRLREMVFGGRGL
jgi:hypothetical protein